MYLRLCSGDGVVICSKLLLIKDKLLLNKDDLTVCTTCTKYDEHVCMQNPRIEALNQWRFAPSPDVITVVHVELNNRIPASVYLWILSSSPITRLYLLPSQLLA